MPKVAACELSVARVLDNNLMDIHGCIIIDDCDDGDDDDDGDGDGDDDVDHHGGPSKHCL